MSSLSPWQCGLHSSKERDNALFLNKSLSDLTIIFPCHNISFPAHRLMIAKTFPYFENLFYGSMAMHDQEWNVKDNDVEPEVFKVVLAHCYEISLLDESLEMTLQVYKLADCYMIDSLKFQCLEHLVYILSKFNYSDILHILEWATKYGFLDIEDKVFELCLIKLEYNGCYNVYKNISKLLLHLPLEKQKKILSRCENLNELIFQESWRQPDVMLSCEVLMSILKSSRKKHGCKNEYTLLKGCYSPKILIKIINMKRLSVALNKKDPSYELSVYMSLINELHSKTLYECIKDKKYPELVFYINLHIPCKKISPDSLAIWSSKEVLFLYLSNVDDQCVPWAVDTILSLQPYKVSLPRSSLSCKGFKTLLENLESASACVIDINICSCNIRKELEEELNTLTKLDISIYELDDDLQGW